MARNALLLGDSRLLAGHKPLGVQDLTSHEHDFRSHARSMLRGDRDCPRSYGAQTHRIVCLRRGHQHKRLV